MKLESLFEISPEQNPGAGPLWVGCVPHVPTATQPAQSAAQGGRRPLLRVLLLLLVPELTLIQRRALMKVAVQRQVAFLPVAHVNEMAQVSNL